MEKQERKQEPKREPQSKDEVKANPKVVEAGVPYLGLCLGAQLLTRAAGGRVAPHPEGVGVRRAIEKALRRARMDRRAAMPLNRERAHAVMPQQHRGGKSHQAAADDQDWNFCHFAGVTNNSL